MLKVPGTQDDSHSVANQAKQAFGGDAPKRGILDAVFDSARETPSEQAAEIFKLRARSGVAGDLIEANLEEARRLFGDKDFDAESFRNTPKYGAWLASDKNRIAVHRQDLQGFQKIEELYHLKDDPYRPLSDVEVDLWAMKESERQVPKGGPFEDVAPPGYPTGAKAQRELIFENLVRKRREEENYIARTGKAGFKETLLRKSAKNPIFTVPFFADVVNGINSGQLWASAKAYENGEDTEDDRDRLFRLARLQNAAERRGEDIAGISADIISAMPAVIGEFSSTGGAYRGVKLAVQGTLRKSIEGVVKGYTRSLSGKAIGAMAGAGTQAVAMSSQRIPGSIIDKMTPGISLSKSDKGELEVVLNEDAADGFGEAVLKTLGHEYIQALSERTGMGVEKLIGSLKATILKRGISRSADGVRGVLARTKDAVGWNGVIGEVFEERVAEVAEGVTGVAPYTPPSFDQLVAEVMSFGLLSAPGFAARTMSDRLDAKHGKALRASVTLNELRDTVQTLKSMEFAPDQAEEAVKAIVQGTGNEFQYMKARQFQEHFQDQKDDDGKAIVPKELAEKLGVPEQDYQTAVDKGLDMKIPTEKYVTQIANSPYVEFFQDKLRSNPLDMSIEDTEKLLTEREKEGAENVARASVSQTELIDAAKSVAIRAAKATLSELKKADVIAQVSEVLGKRAGANAPLKPKDLQRAAKLMGLTKDILSSQIVAAQIERGRVEGNISQGTIPDYIMEAVESEEMKKSLATQYRAVAGRKESEVAGEIRAEEKEAKAEEARVAAKAKNEERIEKVIKERSDKAKKADSLKRIGDQITQALKQTKFSREAATYAKLVVQAFKRFGERSGIDPAELFGQYTLTIEESGEDGKRGKIRIGDSAISIHLPKEADLTTFLHELGHLYLKVMGDIAMRPDAPQEIKDDFAAIREWLGLKDGEPITDKHHEKFARAFELYLMDGVTPSQILRGAFYRFKEWMLAAYETAKESYFAGISLDSRTRSVFDRLLASEAEIEDARREEGMMPLFEDAKKVGWSDAKAEKYARMVIANREKAAQKLFQESMAELKREDEEWWERELASKKEEIAKEVDSRQVYQALAVLKSGKLPNGESLPGVEGDIKLNRESVTAWYPDETGTKPNSKIPSWAMAKQGIDPRTAAEWFKYPSASDFLNAVAEAEPRDSLIERLADEAMEAQYGKKETDESRAERVATLLHNDEYFEILKAEMEGIAVQSAEQLREMGGNVASRIPDMKVLREGAIRDVGNIPVRDLDPRKYQAAERRAQVEAVRAYKKGDWEGALQALTEKAYSAAMFHAASKAKEYLNDSLVGFRKLFRSDERLVKSRDLDVVNAARAVLARVNIGKSDRSASSYLEKIRLYDPSTYEVLNQIVLETSEGNKEFKDLKFHEFEKVAEAVNALWEQSLRTLQFEVAGEKISMQEAVDKVKAQLHKIKAPAEKKKVESATTALQMLVNKGLSIRSALRMVESWADSMDNGDINGPIHTYIVRPIFDAAEKYRTDKKRLEKSLHSMFDKIRSEFTAEEIDAPEIGYVFGTGINGGGMAELLGAMQHMGNESNLSKLLRGYGWGKIDEEGEWEGVLDTSKWDALIRRLINEGKIKKIHMDFLQGIWDLLEAEKPKAQKVYRDMYGRYFEEVKAKPIETPWGAYRGGYVPARIDPTKVPDAQIRDDQRMLDGDIYESFPTTGRGATMTRAEGYARKLDLNIAHLNMHLDWLSRFINLEPRVKDVARLLNNDEMREAFDEFDKTLIPHMLTTWLKRSALQITVIPSKFPGVDKFFNDLRARSSMLRLAGNFVNALLNPLGLLLSSTKVGWKYLRNSLWRYKSDPKEFSKSIVDKSEFMRNLMDTEQHLMAGDMREILLNPSKYEKFKDLAQRHAYFLQRLTQGFVNSVTWQAAYDQAINEQKSDEQAIREADSVVRLTQGAHSAENLSSFEAQSSFIRLFTMFYRYFNIQANLLGSEFAKTMRELGLKAGAGKAAYIFAMGFMIPAAMSEVIVQAMAGGLEGDDDDSYMDDVMGAFFGSQLRSALSLVPGGGVLRAFFGGLTKEPYDDRVNVSPAQDIIEQGAKAPYRIYQHIVDGSEVKASKTIKDSLSLLGLLTGLPTSLVSRPLGYLTDVAEGEAEPGGVTDFTRGLMTGKPGR